MSKQMSRVTGVVAMMLFAVAVMLFAVAAGSPARSQDLIAKAQPTPPLVSAKPTQSGKEYLHWRFETVFTTKMVVGSCNTTQGCKALKNVCETLPKHDFATDVKGRVGVCADTTRNSDDSVWFVRQHATFPVSGGTAHTKTAGNTSNEGGNNEVINKRPGGSQAQRKIPMHHWTWRDVDYPALNCEGAAICKKVQSSCATLGGTYKPRNDVSGSCKH